MGNDFEIDLVYLWVDGNDIKWQAEKEEWQEKLGVVNLPQTNGCRFVDNQELKYSLRSAEMYAPWINKIFIVTNGQVPSWLDTSHPKIKIITHDQIMPRDALPTFNSEAIETCIANIPGLSEHFLYANDDMFFNRPVTPDFFFDEKGNPIVRLISHDWNQKQIPENLYCQNIIYSRNLILEKFGHEYNYEPTHNIDPYKKSLIKDCKKMFEKEFKDTCYSKFRNPNSIQRIIYYFYQMAIKNLTIKHYESLKNDETFYLKLEGIDSLSQSLKKFKGKLFVINDEEYTKVSYRNGLKKFLASYLPIIQDWEDNINFEIKPVFEAANTKTIVFVIYYI